MKDGRDEFTFHKEKANANPAKESLQDVLALMQQETHLRSEDVRPSDSYWHYRPTKDFPPGSIRNPSDYDGSDRLNIACTQTELKLVDKKKLVESWCEVYQARPAHDGTAHRQRQALDVPDLRCKEN